MRDCFLVEPLACHVDDDDHDDDHGQNANARLVNVVSRPFANVLVEQNHCHGLSTVKDNCDWTRSATMSSCRMSNTQTGRRCRNNARKNRHEEPGRGASVGSPAAAARPECKKMEWEKH